MIHETRPIDFKPRFEVTSCFVQNDGKILLLHRQDHKPEGNTWGVPAGKIDSNENPLTAIERETSEETGLFIAADQFEHFKKVYVRYPDYDFVYHIFHTNLKTAPEIKINTTEHKEFQWLSPSAALELDLIQDLDSCIKLFFNL